MRIFTFLLFLVLGLNLRAADIPPSDAPAPAQAKGVIILNSVAGYPAATTSFVSIVWVNNDGGYVIQPAGAKLAFVNIAIAKIVYFDQIYYDTLNHDRAWLDFRAGLQTRETVVQLPDPVTLPADSLSHLQAEQQKLVDIIGVYPSGKPSLDPLIASFQDACSKLSSGLVLQDGKWLPAKDAAPPAPVPTIGEGQKLTTFTTKDGKTYENVSVSVSDSGLSVVTPEGGALVGFDQLPDDLSLFPQAIQKQIEDTKAQLEQAKVDQNKADEKNGVVRGGSSAPSSGVGATANSYMEGFFHFLQSTFSSSPPAAAPSTSTPASTPSASSSEPHVGTPVADSAVSTMLNGKLIATSGLTIPTPGPGVQYYAIYYSAQWCPPCHTFSPRLVDWYNKFKPKHPNFELIFVSQDHDENAMFDYMKEMAMPWPAVRFKYLKHSDNNTVKSSGVEQYAGAGIPDLVLIDSSGKVLSDSFQGSTYVGPNAVVDDINKIVGGPNPVPLGALIPALPGVAHTLVTDRN